MITRDFFASKTVAREDAPPLVLSYYILHDGSVYGAEIKLECNGAWHSASISDITPSKARITALVGLLCVHCVTPCTLEDIILDSLNKY